MSNDLAVSLSRQTSKNRKTKSWSLEVMMANYNWKLQSRIAWLLNAITPLNAYFALIISFAVKYQKDASVGTVVAFMLLCVLVVFVVWSILLGPEPGS
jgi:hypothetical protein